MGQIPNASPWTRQERQEQHAQVAELLAQYASERRVLQVMKTKWGNQFTHKRVRFLVKQIVAEWVVDAQPEKKEERRAKQVATVQESILRLGTMAQAAMSQTPPDVSAARGCLAERRHHVELLAKLTGTEQPQEVNVNVSHTFAMSETMAACFAMLTQEQTGEWLLRAQEDERLANEYRRLQAKPAIDTVGEEVAAE